MRTLETRCGRGVLTGVLALATAIGLPLEATAQRFALPVVNEDDEPGEPMESAPYFRIDNVQGDWVNLMNPPYRPMVLHAGDELYEMWALDNHNNQVHYFIDATGEPNKTFGTPAGPVSMARWHDGTDDRLVIVCRTSWVVCLMDEDDGTILGVIQMEDPQSGENLGEPSDIVIVGGRAYVSCSASDAVAEIDLATQRILDVLYLPSKHPTFLSVDDAGHVYVVPQNSGNNTLVHRAENAGLGHVGPLGVINGDDLSIVESTGGLQDRDVFKITPGGDGPSTIEPWARNVGTVLFGHVWNGGKLWVLNSEANLKDPTKFDEASLKGEIAFNRLSILDPAVDVGSYGLLEPADIKDLDPLMPDPEGGPDMVRNPDLAVGQPFNLHVDPNTGFVFIVGLLTDNVTLLDPNGNFVLEWDLPEGSIPRQVVYFPELNSAFVYCWGTNEILGYIVEPVVGEPWGEFQLGLDPTPDELEIGRATMYDASKSLGNRFSCLTCHIDAGIDGLAWPIEKRKDPKGPMVTQSLTGLETVHPFHWRGEQEGERPAGAEQQLMVDFNGTFEDLLGGTKLDETPGEEWDRFEDFVFSMQSPANPFQHDTRRVHRDIDAPLFNGAPNGDPIMGQEEFKQGCMSCHDFPKGTSNDFTADGFPDLDPHQTDFKVAMFQEAYRREQDADRDAPGIQVETVDFVDSVENLPDSDTFPPLGNAFSHGGLFRTLHDFVLIFFPVFTLQSTSNITDYIHQWDNGIAPYAHHAWFVDENAGPDVFAEIRTQLMPQVTRLYRTGDGQEFYNVDVAVIGTWFDADAGVERNVRWYWERSVSRFVPDDSRIGHQTLNAILQQAEDGLSRSTFIGMPVGTSRRFAIDYDNDGYPNQDELNHTPLPTDPENPDSDDDSYPDGYEVALGSDPNDDASTPTDDAGPGFVDDEVEVLWRTAKTAVLNFRTTEQARAVISYATVGGSGDSGFITLPYGRTHRAVLANLDPTEDYVATVDIFDHSNNPNVEEKTVSFTMNFFNGPGTRTKIEDLTFTQVPANPTDPITLRVQVGKRRNSGTPDPAENRHVIARVCIDGDYITDPADLDTLGGPSAFTVAGDPYTVRPGPFVLSTTTTDGGGFADLSFALPNAQAGQTVTIVLFAAQTPSDDWTLQAPDFDTLADWSHSDTPKDLRTIDLDL